MSPLSPHISWLFIYFYKIKVPKKVRIQEKKHFQQRHFYAVLTTYIYLFVKLRAAPRMAV